MKKKLLFPLLSVLLMMGCKEEDFVTRLTTDLPDNKISFSSTEKSIKHFTIETNSTWNIQVYYDNSVDYQNWLHMSQSAGNNDRAIIDVYVNENSSDKERNCQIVISIEDKEVTIDVSQSQKNILENVSTKYIKVPDEGGSFNVKLKSNINAVLISKPEWIENTNSKSTTEQEYSFTASPLPNSEKYGRAGVMIYKDQNTGDSLNYFVSQAYAIYNPANQTWSPTADFQIALQEMFGDDYPLTLKKLKVIGSLCKYDFDIFTNMFVLEDLDISDVNIVGDIDIGSSIPHKGNAIPTGAFSNNRIKNIKLPNVTHIGYSSFLNSKLQELTIPNSVIYIGSMAFNGFILSELSIPNSVIYIGEGAFTSYGHLDEVSVYWDNSEELPDIKGAFSSSFIKDFEEPDQAKFITIPKNSSAIYQTKGWEIYNTRER